MAPPPRTSTLSSPETFVPTLFCKNLVRVIWNVLKLNGVSSSDGTEISIAPPAKPAVFCSNTTS